MRSRPFDKRPFAAWLRVRGDPGGGAFYGWRVEGWCDRSRYIAVSFPARLPTGPLWIARRVGGEVSWKVPRQRAAGALVHLELAPGTIAIATAPGPLDAPMPERLGVGNDDGADRLAVVIAGQHPGEGGAIALAIEIMRIAHTYWPRSAGRLLVVPLVNRSGWARAHTRETAEGRDLNRSWHDPAALGDLAELREAMARATFVLDIHGDEHAVRPYRVGPTPALLQVAERVAAFSNAVGAVWPALGPRPRAPGEGEDDPGILVNWLARQGVPGMMLELPMRSRRVGERKVPPFALRRRTAEAARMTLAAMAAVKVCSKTPISTRG